MVGFTKGRMNSRLTNSQVDEIVRALANGDSTSEIAARYGVTDRTVHAIGAGTRWGRKPVVRPSRASIPSAQRDDLFARHVRESVTYRQLSREEGVALATLIGGMRDAAIVIGAHARTAMRTQSPLPASIQRLELPRDVLMRLSDEAPNERDVPKRLVVEMPAD